MIIPMRDTPLDPVRPRRELAEEHVGEGGCRRLGDPIHAFEFTELGVPTLPMWIIAPKSKGESR